MCFKICCSINIQKFISYQNVFLLFLILLLPIQISLATSDLDMQELNTIVLGGGTSKAVFQGIVKQQDNNHSALIFEDDVALDISFSIKIAPEDESKKSQLYLVAQYNGQWFYLNQSQQWQAFIGDISSNMSELQSYTSKTLSATETIEVNSKQLFGAGEYLFYSGYLNHQNKIVHNQKGLGLIIFSSENAELHRFKSAELFTSYFQKAIAGTNNDIIITSGSSISGSPSTTQATGNVSSTNIQELGVDEADVIKSNGSQLFALDSCQGSNNSTCLQAYQINEFPASNQFLSQYSIDSENSKGKIYLTNIDTIDGPKEIVVRLAGQQAFYWSWWGYPATFSGQTTEINMLDVSSPESIQAISEIKLDGTLISSRRIGNTLYLVTRTSPEIENFNPYYPLEPNGHVTQEEIDANLQLLDDISIADIIPNITIGSNSPVALHQVDDCFLPPQDSSKMPDKSIISITAISLDNPDTFRSSCIIGSTETFYASPKSIYLASSRYEYDNESGTFIFNSGGEFTTEIHKFSLTEEALLYKASGSITGSLGWEVDKKPFRMGEYNDELRIATSVGTRSAENSSTSLTVLKENEDTGTLEKIGGLDGLGKTDEYLYASRFIGKRGYLVTFRQTDPLYVLDLEDGSNPRIIAELEIDGFSEYLHPIGDTHLLGIGKNAIVTTDENGNENSWIQGVKLSLFDVSSSDSVTEVQSMEIGKRGTSSEVLRDHHAFSFLDAHNSSPARFAIPIDLYDTVPENNYYELDDPRAYYDWTHTGLYVFDLNTSDSPGFKLSGKLITAEAIPDYYYTGPRYGHSIIQGNSIHYFYNHQLYSSAISDLEQ